MDRWIARQIRRGVSVLLYRLRALPKMSREDRAELLGFRLTIPVGVFHPTLFFSSAILGRHVAAMDLRGKRILDMGTGTGVLALCAARQGASVVAVDINPEAVRSAQANATQNGLERRITVLHADLFEAIPSGERFDLVLWNPPFYPGEPEDEAQRAWRAGNGFSLISRFANSVADFLAPGGAVFVILTSDVDPTGFFRPFASFAITTQSTHRRFFETLSIYRLTPGGIRRSTDPSIL